MSWANPRISTISVHDGPILRKKLPSTLRLVNFLLDVRRFWQQAVVDEIIGKNDTSLTWHYEEMLVRASVTSGQVEAKPAHSLK